jgi:hypothetical protein
MAWTHVRLRTCCRHRHGTTPDHRSSNIPWRWPAQRRHSAARQERLRPNGPTGRTTPRRGRNHPTGDGTARGCDPRPCRRGPGTDGRTPQALALEAASAACPHRRNQVRVAQARLHASPLELPRGQRTLVNGEQPSMPSVAADLRVQRPVPRARHLQRLHDVALPLAT